MDKKAHLSNGTMTSATSPASQYAASSKMMISPDTPFNDCESNRGTASEHWNSIGLPTPAPMCVVWKGVSLADTKTTRNQ